MVLLPDVLSSQRLQRRFWSSVYTFVHLFVGRIPLSFCSKMVVTRSNSCWRVSINFHTLGCAAHRPTRRICCSNLLKCYYCVADHLMLLGAYSIFGVEMWVVCGGFWLAVHFLDLHVAVVGVVVGNQKHMCDQSSQQVVLRFLALSA